MTHKSTDFTNYLIQHKLFTKEALTRALAEADKNQLPIVAYLTQNNLIDDDKLAYLIAEYFNLPLFDLNFYNEQIIPYELINEQLATNPQITKRHALPLAKHDGCLFLAVIDPTLPNLDEIGFITGLHTKYVIVEFSKLKKLVDNLATSQLAFALDNLTDDQTKIEMVDDRQVDNLDVTKIDTNAAPIVRFINEVLLDAINKGASDIHFEPYNKTYRIRFRRDGILYEVSSPPVNLISHFVARLKVMANLDISEHRTPQDGRFKIALAGGRTIDFRMSTCPMLYGEKIVLRILDQSSRTANIENLGMEEYQKKFLLDAIDKTQGIILVTGPTGSGKTVTLYTALGILNTIEKNISTVEDPVEIELSGVNQVHVNPAINLTFSTALRSFLRQDPDIIMVGEIRDLETAEIAVKASQTGHLVLSTLHTNSAPETIVRLSNMGVEPFNISSSITLIIAQRLARKLCVHCKKPAKLPKEVLIQQGFAEDEIKDLNLYGPGACDNCMNGYIGRTGIYEMMPISDDLKRMIMLGKGALDLREQAKQEGMFSLREAGLCKVKAGITSLEELNRVIRT